MTEIFLPGEHCFGMFHDGTFLDIEAVLTRMLSRELGEAVAETEILLIKPQSRHLFQVGEFRLLKPLEMDGAMAYSVLEDVRSIEEVDPATIRTPFEPLHPYLALRITYYRGWTIDNAEVLRRKLNLLTDE